MARPDDPASSYSRSGLRPSSPLFEAWVEEARSADILAEAQARGAKLRRSGAEWYGPCPACGGSDRFSVNTAKGIFNCRGAGRGGDVIGLVEYLDACDFIAACTTLTGREPPTRGEKGGTPDRDGKKHQSAVGNRNEEELRRRARDRERQQEERERGETDYREQERYRAWGIWKSGLPFAGTPVEAYLAGRAIVLPVMRSMPLRYVEALEYWHRADGWPKPQVIYCGPAMLAAIVDDTGRFAGVHMTWFDPDDAGKKATIADPATGEVLPAKKIRGSKRRAAIRLFTKHDGDVQPAWRLVIGEGIETVLSVLVAEWRAPMEAGRRDLALGSEYWAAIDLGHLGGRAAKSVAHPTWIVIDKRGRKRLRQVPGPEPLLDPERDLMPDVRFSEIVILGDGDSDRFTTEMAVRRAAARWAIPGGPQEARRAERPTGPPRKIFAAWPGDGVDFNDVLRRQPVVEAREKEGAA
jgi:hypothetical protein